jgi:hypothetical protein
MHTVLVCSHASTHTLAASHLLSHELYLAPTPSPPLSFTHSRVSEKTRAREGEGEKEGGREREREREREQRPAPPVKFGDGADSQSACPFHAPHSFPSINLISLFQAAASVAAATAARAAAAPRIEPLHPRWRCRPRAEAGAAQRPAHPGPRVPAQEQARPASGGAHALCELLRVGLHQPQRVADAGAQLGGSSGGVAGEEDVPGHLDAQRHRLPPPPPPVIQI